MVDDAFPKLDETRCTGNAACVAACPTACLELRGRLPWLARPGDCLSCGACAAVCPTEAITFLEANTPVQGGGDV